MGGMNENSGVKIYIHDQKEIMFVKKLGTVVPTSMYTEMAIKQTLVRIENKVKMKKIS